VGRHITLSAVSILALLAAASVGAHFGAGFVAAASSGHRHAVKTIRTRDEAVSLAAFGIRFTAVSGAQPAVSQSQAIAAALQQTAAASNGQLLPGVSVSAQYGLFSDDVLGDRQPSGAFVLRYQNTPAWIVTFSGPGVNHGPMGGPRQGAQGSGQTPVTGVHHEENVVIDATTGSFMELFS